MDYVLELENYRGPIEKLLELIEERKMEVTAVSMARVTGDFIAYFQELKEAEEKTEKRADVLIQADLKMMLADFLVIASRLLLLKSKTLLPVLELSDEEEADIKDLEARVQIYQELKGAKAHIMEGWQEAPVMLGREFLMAREAVFFPPGDLRAEDIFRAFSKVVGELEKLLLPIQKVKREVINLKSKIEERLERISKGSLAFHEFHQSRTRSELVVLFLAVLHLIKDQLVHVRQDGHLGKMTIARRSDRG